MAYLVLIWVALHAILLILSYRKIRGSRQNIAFIYRWAMFFGAFVWEDLLVFSALNVAGALIVLATRDIRIGLVLLGIFWVVRSTGEAAYFMLQQFLQPKHHPHEIDGHFGLLRAVFGNISKQQCFILMQVFHQVHVIAWIAVVIVIMSNWYAMPRWF